MLVHLLNVLECRSLLADRTAQGMNGEYGAHLLHGAASHERLEKAFADWFRRRDFYCFSLAAFAYQQGRIPNRMGPFLGRLAARFAWQRFGKERSECFPWPVAFVQIYFAFHASTLRLLLVLVNREMAC